MARRSAAERAAVEFPTTESEAIVTHDEPYRSPITGILLDPVTRHPVVNAAAKPGDRDYGLCIHRYREEFADELRGEVADAAIDKIVNSLAAENNEQQPTTEG